MGREVLVKRIQEYITSPTDQPMVVYGETGTGKTSLLAKAASHVIQWLGPECSPILILRFLGMIFHSRN